MGSCIECGIGTHVTEASLEDHALGAHSQSYQASRITVPSSKTTPWLGSCPAERGGVQGCEC